MPEHQTTQMKRPLNAMNSVWAEAPGKRQCVHTTIVIAPTNKRPRVYESPTSALTPETYFQSLHKPLYTNREVQHLLDEVERRYSEKY